MQKTTTYLHIRFQGDARRFFGDACCLSVYVSYVCYVCTSLWGYFFVNLAPSPGTNQDSDTLIGPVRSSRGPPQTTTVRRDTIVCSSGAMNGIRYTRVHVLRVGSSRNVRNPESSNARLQQDGSKRYLDWCYGWGATFVSSLLQPFIATRPSENYLICCWQRLIVLVSVSAPLSGCVLPCVNIFGSVSSSEVQSYSFEWPKRGGKNWSSSHTVQPFPGQLLYVTMPYCE